MKIALVSPYDLAVPGGVNSHIHHLADHFVARGHEVRIIAPASDVRNLSPYAIVIGRPRSIPAGGSIARMSTSPRLADPVRRILAEEQFDVVHVHEPLVSFMTIQFLRFSKAVNVGTFHAARESGARLYVYTRRLLKDCFRRLDGKIAVSQAAAALIAPHFPGYYNIIPNGVDVERFSAPAAPLPELDDGMTNILFVGRLEKRKGLRYLLRAFEQVKQARPQTRLVVVGGYDARQKRAYERWMKESGLSDVAFVGFVPLETLPRYHHSAHIFCAPNTGNESQGIVLLEAMAAGKAIVATRVGGNREVIIDGDNGLLVEPEDPRALAEAISTLLNDSALSERMSCRSLDLIQRYEWSSIVERYLMVVQEVVPLKRTGEA